ncbi:MAG: hypothetical protein KAI44_04740 [Methylococcales bacterium]|nr:hypothetical protein [Methylococcales bacterium]
MNQGGSRDPAFKRAKLNHKKEPKPLSDSHGENLREKIAKLKSENVHLEFSILSEEKKVAELEMQLESLARKCQARTDNGTQCNEPADRTTDWHGVEIFVCQQHSIQKKQ